MAFHVGPLLLHTYGIGLALTFWFAYRYLERRLREHGLEYAWLTGAFLWIIGMAIVGARVVHVVANVQDYTANPLLVFAVWQGGLSSFGGLLFGVPTGFYLAHRHLRGQVSLWAVADLVAPVLLAAWALGRILGPQLMFAGGGHPTHQWFGMYYAGEVGKRLPVPLFQSLETLAMFLIVLRVERWATARGGPTGLVPAVTFGLWGMGRFFEEYLWLSYPGHVGAIAVEVAGAVMSVVGWVAAVVLLVRARPAPPVASPPAEPEPELETAR